MIDFRPLHPEFGVECLDVRVADLVNPGRFPAIRDLFDRHSFVLFRDQEIGPEDHMALARAFGPLENRASADLVADGSFAIPRVSNIDADGQVIDADDLHVLNLKANQLWHTDSTFLPVPALANILVSRVVPSTGGETELASTRAAWRDMPEDLRRAAETPVVRHRFGHSRRKISDDLAAMDDISKWDDQLWRAAWTNPVTNETALYIASHACGIEGMDDPAAAAIISAWIEFATQPSYVYTHKWRPGDVLIFDERATLHRGCSWPYEEARRLDSICVSAQAEDGLASVSP